MAKKSKRQVRLKREKAKKNKIKKMENQDKKGISRKHKGFEISFKQFFVMKLIGIILIPIIYFVYSPLLVLVIIYYISLYYFALACENRLNKNIIKSNYIQIPKYDSALAFILLIISTFSFFFSFKNRGGRFANTFISRIVEQLKNFGNLQTGQRSIFRNIGFKFGTMDKPDDFVPMGDKPDMKPDDFSMDNIPVEFMFNQIISTGITVMIFSISILGIISLISTYYKIKNFNKEMNSIEIDTGFTLSDEEIERILDFDENNV